jgi:hypothetical protein
VIGKIYGPKEDEVSGQRRMLHNKELPFIQNSEIKKVTKGWTFNLDDERRNLYKIL